MSIYNISTKFLYTSGIVFATAVPIAILGGHMIRNLYRESFFISQDLQRERQRSESLLRNILPEEITDRLKQGEDVAENFDGVTVLFADIVEFTPLANKLSANKVVDHLDRLFSSFDQLVLEFDLEKIKTIGDEYFVAAGVPEPREDHAVKMAELALAMQAEAKKHERDDGQPFKLRMGMNTGPLVAGIIGEEKFVYDVWGDTVNIGSRMESHGEPGKIQVTPATKQAIEEQGDEKRFKFEERGTIEVKGKGEMTTYFLRT